MKALVRNAILCLPGIWLASFFPPVLYGQALAYSKASFSPQQGNPAVRLRDILLDMQEKHNINIVFDDNLLQGLLADPAKIKRSGKISGVLESLLRETGLQAIEIRKNTYLIIARKDPDPRRTAQPDPIAPTSGIDKITLPQPVPLPAQLLLKPLRITIRGSVADEKGEALPGVNILVKGTQQGTTTGVDGSFAIEVPDENAVLVFSFVGYVTQEVIAGNRNSLEIRLISDQKALEEVIVVGYGTQKAINLTGAVSQISSKELEDRPVNRLTQALQGTIPNLNVTFGSGKPGTSGSLNIRGNTSINGGTPLVLIDGVPGDLDRININDVETVTVLKDASASAVYGARAAFGVILVTTKTAKSGKTSFSYSNNFAASTHATNTDYITSGYWNAKLNDDAMYNALGATNTRYNDLDYERLLQRVNDKTEHPDRPWVIAEPNSNGVDMYRYYANFDWFNYLFKKWRPRDEHNISINGSTERIRYLLSGTIAKEYGMWKVRPDKYNRANLRAKLDIDVTKNLTIGTNIRYFSSNYSWFGLEDNFPTVTNNVTPIHLYHFMPAYVPKNPDGTLTGYTGVNSYSVGYGMHAIMENGKSKGEDKLSEFVSTLEATYKIGENVKLTANYSYQQDTKDYYYRATRVQYSKFPGVLENYAVGGLNRDELKQTFQNNQYHIINIFGNFNKTWGRHDFTAMAGFNQEERIFKTLGGTGQELLSETLNDLNLTSGENIVSGGASEWALRGAFYRLNYAFADKYLLEVSGRYDGTSRFPKADRFGFFPSASVGWRISEERFFQPLKKVFDDLKFRYSYGSLGNQQVGTYAYISSMSTGRINWLVNEDRINVVNNPAPVANSLTWERTITNNIGIDASFLRNRLSLVADFYIRDTKDMLTQGKKLPAVFGASEPNENAADLRTKGFELSLGWNDQFELAGSSFRYSFRGILSDYTARITRFDNPTRLLSNYYVGQQLGEIWGYRYDGYFKTTDEAQAYAKTVDQDPINRRRVQAPTAELKMLQAGDIKILDLDGSGRIDQGANTVDNPGDRTIIGNSQPRFAFSFTPSFSWKGIDLSAFFQGIGKQNWYPHLEAQQFWHVYARPYGSFIPEGFQNMVWSPENPNAYFPRMIGYIAQNSELSVANDMYLQNTAYCKLKNLTIGYTIPANLTKRLKIDRARIYASGENLFTWTGFDTDYIDPEETLTDPTARTYPMSRVYSIGLNISF